MAVLIKSKVSAKAPAKVSAKAPAKKAVREPVSKRFFLSKEQSALWAMKGVDLIPCYWRAGSCRAASEFGASVVSQADKIKSAKLAPKTGWFLVGVGPKGARCVAIKSAHGQIYERMRDGVSLVRGDASTAGAFIGERKACENWLKANTKKGLTDYWRSKDGSKETARKAGFTCF